MARSYNLAGNNLTEDVQSHYWLQRNIIILLEESSSKFK